MLSGGDIYDLIHVAFACGGLLLIEGLVLLWCRKPLRVKSRLLLIGMSFAVSVAAFVLAYAASRHPNSIACISTPPLIGVDRVAQARLEEASCRAYFFFSSLIVVTCFIGSMLIVIGGISLFAPRTNDM